MENYQQDEDEKRFINKEDAKPNNQYHMQEFACPSCGSYNTYQVTYADGCNSCNWVQHY